MDAAEPRVPVLDFGALLDIEYSALKMLTEGEEKLRESGVQLRRATLDSEASGMVQRSSPGETLGCERFLLQVAKPRAGLASVNNQPD